MNIKEKNCIAMIKLSKNLKYHAKLLNYIAKNKKENFLMSTEFDTIFISKHIKDMRNTLSAISILNNATP